VIIAAREVARLVCPAAVGTGLLDGENLWRSEG
jgi:hypothetical protein